MSNWCMESDNPELSNFEFEWPVGKEFCYIGIHMRVFKHHTLLDMGYCLCGAWCHYVDARGMIQDFFLHMNDAKELDRNIKEG